MDFQSVLDQHGVKYDISGRNKNRPGWINLQCPYCGRDPYLGYSISARAFSCWNCGKHAAAETIQLLTGLSMREVWDIVKELPREYVGPPKKIRGTLKLPFGISGLKRPHQAYLKGRGFDPAKLAKLWGVQGLDHFGGYLKWRLFIPVHFEGEVVAWTTRRLDNKEPRYHDGKPSESAIPIKDCCYGIDYCRSSVIICEGPTDVWAIGPGAVCLFGLRHSASQLEALSRFPVRVVLFDSGAGEAGAARRARTLCRELSPFDGTTIKVTLESGSDPAKADPSEIEEIRKRYLL